MALAVLCLLVLGGMWYLNHWLKSPAMHATLEKELSLALKMPVHFTKVQVSLLGTLTAQGISVPDRGSNFFEADSFTAKADFNALIHGRVALNEIKVEAPHFVMVQRPNGDWKRPDLPADLQAELDARQGPKKVKDKDKDKDATKTADAKKATPAPKKASDFHVGVILIANGSIDLIDKAGQPFVSALGMAAKVNDLSEDKVEGYLSVSRLVWHRNFAAANVRGTIKQTPDQLIIEKISANVGNGKLTGGYSHKSTQPGPPFSLKLACEGVDISKAAMDADAAAPNLDGNLTGTLEMRGAGDNRKTFNGKALFTLQNGTCREIEWVNQLSEVLQYEDVDLAAFKIREVKADIQFALDKLAYNSLVIDAPPVRMVAAGESKFDGTKLRLDSQLLADAKFLSKRPNVAPQFGPEDGTGMRPLPFLLTGSFSKPKQNLIERLTGTNDRMEQNIKLGLDALSNLKDERKKKNGISAGPAAATVPADARLQNTVAPPPERLLPSDRPAPTLPAPVVPAERPAPAGKAPAPLPPLEPSPRPQP